MYFYCMCTIKVSFRQQERSFTTLQRFSCACKLNLCLQSYVHFHKSYHTHANLYDVKIHTHTHTHAHKLTHTWRSQFKNRANHQLSTFLQKARSSLKYESVRSGLLNKWAGHVRVIMYSFETHLTRSDLFTSLSSAGVFNAARVRQQIRLTLHLIF